MRRIDAIAIALGVFIFGGGVYLALRLLGIEGQTAGVWSQAVLVVGLLGWLATYFLRVFTQKMTYNQQRADYEDSFLQKKLEEMSPEELAALQADVDQDP